MHPLVRHTRQALKQAADPEKARWMQACMKSPMPYRGVTAPRQRRLWRELLAAHPLASHDEWQSAALELWRGAKFREERYAAIAIVDARRYAPFLGASDLPMLEEMIVTGAWGRAAILSQIRFKGDTDLALLYDCIEPNLADREFFIRKAIGWALRQLAGTNPREVKRYVRANRQRLSGLSVKEALKHIRSS